VPVEPARSCAPLGQTAAPHCLAVPTDAGFSSSTGTQVASMSWISSLGTQLHTASHTAFHFAARNFLCADGIPSALGVEDAGSHAMGSPAWQPSRRPCCCSDHRGHLEQHARQGGRRRRGSAARTASLTLSQQWRGGRVAGRAASPGLGQQVGGGHSAAGLLLLRPPARGRERAQIGSLGAAGTAFLLYNHEQWAVYS
jgi:hypothetical protein